MRPRFFRSDARRATKRFYLDLYRQGDFHRLLTAPGLARARIQGDRRTGPAGRQRSSMSAAAKAGWRAILPHAVYVGLDPNFSSTGRTGPTSGTKRSHSTPRCIPRNTISSARSMSSSMSPTRWDSPVDLAALRQARRAPLHCRAGPYSAITEIPNFVFNAPPHHLSWWHEVRCGHWPNASTWRRGRGGRAVLLA